MRGTHAGTLRPGDRLPSARELAAEFGVDHRSIVAAYRELDSEDFVELRPRGGVYLTASPPSATAPAAWLIDLHLQGIARGLAIPQLADWLYRSAMTRRIKTVVIAATADQGMGLCRELRDVFSLDASTMGTHDLVRGFDPEVRQADLFVTTGAHEAAVRDAAGQVGKPVIVVTIRPDLLNGEWRLLLRRPLYVVVAEAPFGEMLRRFLGDSPGAENLRIVLATADSVATIPPGAPTYVTRGALELLDGIRIPGRILPAARVISDATASEIVALIVRANLDALAGGAPGNTEPL